MKKFFLTICVILLFAIPVFSAGQEMSNPYIQWHKTAIGTVLSTNQVSMTQAVAVIKAAPTSGHYRYSILIRNMDAANTVYVGGSTVTATTGFPLKAGESMTLDRNFAAVYGICGTGLTATVAYIEEGY
jgi:hypothetical protein